MKLSLDKILKFDNPSYELYNIAHKRIFKRRLPREYEKIIMIDPKWAYEYAENIIKGRWKEAEPYIMKDPEQAAYYAMCIMERRWPEIELSLIQSGDLGVLYNYMELFIGDRWPVAEPYIKKHSCLAYVYAKNIIHNRWIEAEPYILKDSWNTYCYIRDVVKGKWQGNLPPICSSGWQFSHAVNLLRREWPETEPAILQSIYESAKYTKKRFGIDIYKLYGFNKIE